MARQDKKRESRRGEHSTPLVPNPLATVGHARTSPSTPETTDRGEGKGPPPSPVASTRGATPAAPVAKVVRQEVKAPTAPEKPRRGETRIGLLPTALAIVLILGSGYVHGRWTGRWSVSNELQDAVARLPRLSMSVGDWQGSELPFEPNELKRSGIAAGLMRSYQDRKTGATVSMLLVCGRPGPIAVHTPDICYRGAGYELAAEPTRDDTRCGLPDHPASFWVADFHKQDTVVPETLKIHWAWSDREGWKAPQNPRLSFAGKAVLYKLYIVRKTRSADDRFEVDPSVAFLHQLLPELDRALLAPPAAAS